MKRETSKNEGLHGFHESISLHADLYARITLNFHWPARDGSGGGTRLTADGLDGKEKLASGFFHV